MLQDKYEYNWYSLLVAGHQLLLTFLTENNINVLKMKRLYVLLSMVAAATAWRLSDLAWDEWNAFKLEHKKHYENTTEENHRMKIYLAKRYMIAKHNRRFHRGLETFSLKTNRFSDLTHQEYLKITKGFKFKTIRRTKNPAAMFLSPANVVMNESVDWRKVGAVSMVQDQLECNSCWAFSAAGALEGQLFRKNKTLVPLSVQNLVDCSKDNFGCEGGNIDDAFEYIKYNKGIDIEKYYPYEAKNDTCRYNPLYSGGYDVGYQDIPEGDEEKLKEAVATIGPISAAIDSTLKSFATYSHGVYYDENCSTNVVHAVLVVGFGTDKVGGDYWLLKNSYGTSWGEEGYMRLARNRKNHCGIASYTSYPLVPQ